MPSRLAALPPTLVLAVAAAIAASSATSSAASAADSPPPPWQRDAAGRPLDGQVLRIEPPPPPLRIAILPDRTTGRAWGLPYLEAAVEDLRRIAPDAVFTIGDMVQGYTRSRDTWDREVEEWSAIVEPLGGTVLPTAGNHDVVSGSRDPLDRAFEDRYRDRFGPLRYSVEFPAATVVVAYSEEDRSPQGPRFSEAQLAWLDETLAAAAARQRPIFLLLHRPLWRSPSAEWDARVHPLLERHGVAAVIAGHFHSLQREPDRDGIQYHILGVCGGAIDQHPLSGQLHHFTMLTVPATPPAEGPRFRLHHQLAGSTLADDFVSSEDQQRAWRLKSDRPVATIEGVLLDGIGVSPQQPLQLVLANPIDRPVEVQWRSLQSPPPPMVTEGMPIASNTPADTFNPFTMRLDAPVVISPGSIVLAPGETRRVPLEAAVEPAAPPWPPPEIRIEATFDDDLGRSVPMSIVRRLPIEREVSLVRPPAGTAWSPGSLPVSAWNFSVYDTLEPDPEIRLGLAADGTLTIRVLARDNRVASPFEDARLDGSRWRNPHLDAVLLRLGSPPEGRLWLFEVLAESEDGELGVASFGTSSPDGPLEAVPTSGGGGATRGLRAIAARLPSDPETPDPWFLEVELPEATWRPLLRDGRLEIQVGVADNDDTYHTQWRWLAPDAAPLRVRIEAPAEGQVDGR